MHTFLQEDSYIQYTSSGPREGDLLQRLEAQQRNENLQLAAPLTMRCFDSFATKDDAGKVGSGWWRVVGGKDG